jgi:2,4-dienoyl-CoA reductase-like NADH-dependent reductase (Old Yellow Enzyme family)
MSSEQRDLFDPVTINNVTFRSRVLRSSLGGRTSYYDGTVTPAWKNFEKRFARPPIGGIISATIDIDDKRLSPLEYPKISDDSFIAPLKDGVEAVQRLGCRYIMQLGDPGGHTQTSLFPQHEDGKSASAYFDLFYGYRNRTSAMTADEVTDEVRKFREAARRVRMIGCDGVEVTASKGYIIHQFLNPATNRRTDQYGGSKWKRFQLLREVVEAVREEVGRDFLFGVRLSAQDFNYLPWWNIRLPPVWPLQHWWMGNMPAETIDYGVELKALGVDYLHIDSGFGFINPKGSPTNGFPIDGLRIFANATRHLSAKARVRAAALNVLPRALLSIGWTYTPAANAKFAQLFKEKVRLPVIANGGFEKRSEINQALESQCDLVALGRALLANPDLLEHYERDPARDQPEVPCTYCSLCCTRTSVMPLGCYDITRFGQPGDPAAQDRMEKQILQLSADHTP